MAATARSLKTRNKIMAAASDLFYRQGYEATVVNQIIGEAGISKPTFYEHFGAKEDLCVAYLRERSTLDLGMVKDAVQGEETALERFVTPMQAIKERMIELDYRGCPFFNMLSEVADPESAIAAEVEVFTQGLHALIEEVTRELLESDAEKYGHLSVESVANAYYVIMGGAITAGQEFREEWPFDTAITLVANLVK